MKIAFVNSKGGVGKTTLAILSCAALREAGRDAVIYDIDPQGTSTKFAPAFGIPLSREGEIVIIDTPPRLEKTPIARAAHTADRIVIVTTPSPAAMAATGEVVPGFTDRKAAILFNMIRCDGFALVADEVTFALPTLRSRFRERAAYQRALLDGWKALDPRAREETLAAALEIMSF